MSLLPFILAGVLLGQTAPPEEPSLSTRFLPGKGRGYCRAGGWATLQISMSNPLKREVAGELVIEVREGTFDGRMKWRHASPVRLPPESRRKIRVPIRGDPGEEDAEMYVTTRLGLSGVPFMESSQYLHPVEPHEPLIANVGGIGERGGLGYVMRTPTWWDASGQDKLYPIVFYCGTDDLPADPVVLRGMHAIFVTRIALWELSPAQQEALIAFVATGGNLIVATAEKGVPHGETALDEILPAIPTSYTEVEGLERLSRLFSDGPPAPGPVPVQALEVRPGASVVIEDGGTPVWVEGRHGSGRVAVIAFDIMGPSLPAWRDTQAVARALLYGVDSIGVLTDHEVAEARDRWGRAVPGGLLEKARLEPPRMTLDRFADTSLKGVLERSQAPIAPTGVIIRIVLAYLIVLVPVNYAVWRRRGRLEGAWATAIVLAIFSTGGVLAWDLARGSFPLQVWELDVEGGVVGGRGRIHRYKFAIKTGSRRTVDVDGQAGLRFIPTGGVALRGGGVDTPDLTASEEMGVRGIEMLADSYSNLEGERVAAREGAFLDRLEVGDGRWRGVIDLGWDGPPDGAILFSLKGWAPVGASGGLGSLLELDVDETGLYSHPAPLEDVSPHAGTWPEDAVNPHRIISEIRVGDAWDEVVEWYLAQGAKLAWRGGRGPTTFLVAWRREPSTILLPRVRQVEAGALRVLVLDLPGAMSGGRPGAVTWSPKLVSHKKLGGRVKYRGMCVVEYIPSRSVAAEAVRDLRLHLDPLTGKDSLPGLFEVLVRNYDRNRWEPVDTGLWTGSGPFPDIPITIGSPFEKETGVARLKIWYGTGGFPEAIRGLRLRGTIPAKEER